MIHLGVLQKNLRGYTAAKMYYKIGEYQSAQHYVSAYISVKRDNAAAYRLLGKCCVHLKKIDNALEAYQKSIQLDANQSDLVVEGNYPTKNLITPRLDKVIINHYVFQSANYFCQTILTSIVVI